MCSIQYVLTFLAIGISFVNSWDIAITHGDQLQFYTNHTKTGSEGSRFGELTALAYDAVHNMLLFVDKKNDHASIFSYHIATKRHQPLVKRKLYEDIQGIAFDPITGLLFWTDKNETSIFWMSLLPGSNNASGKLLIKMDEELPRAIAVDSCRGYIYWTNTNVAKPTIERARFDGSDRKVIVETDIFMPESIAIDQSTKRLYWTNKIGIHYSIESSDLDGTNRKPVVTGQFHRPNSLTVSKDTLYWIEWDGHSVWRLPKEPKPDQEPEALFSFETQPYPYGIVANYNIGDQTKDNPECKELENMSKNNTAVNETFTTNTGKGGLFCLHGELVNGKLECKCSPGYVGERCEQSLCQNYCLHGDCSLSSDGKPVCRCMDGYTGVRCGESLCHSFCLNDGVCSLAKDKSPICQCLSDFEGQRCETKKVLPVINARNVGEEEDKCNCSEATTSKPGPSSFVSEDQAACDSWDPVRDPILMVLGIFSGMLCVACAVLVTRVMHLKRRPRIKKRIIVNKNVTPLTARPDQCEITIEDCCNMNICETPCFEPRSTIRPNLLEGKTGKEEKRNLIANMEQEDF